MKERVKKKVFTGKVISDKMEKTRMVLVSRITSHSVYGKVVRKSKKYAIDDRKNETKVGDIVSFIETRPLSKRKRWRLLKVVEKA